VLQRHFIYDLERGAVSHFVMVVTPPGSTTPTQTIEATVGADSLRGTTKTGDGPAKSSSVALPAGAVVVASSSPWSMYEGAIMRLVAGKSDSLRATMYFIGSDGAQWLSLHKLGRDSVSLFNEHQDQFHVRVDKTGHVLGVLPIAGTPSSPSSAWRISTCRR